MTGTEEPDVQAVVPAPPADPAEVADADAPKPWAVQVLNDLTWETLEERYPTRDAALRGALEYGMQVATVGTQVAVRLARLG